MQERGKFQSFEHSSENFKQLPATQKITFLSYFYVKVVKVRYITKLTLISFSPPTVSERSVLVYMNLI